MAAAEGTRQGLPTPPRPSRIGKGERYQVLSQNGYGKLRDNHEGSKNVPSGFILDQTFGESYKKTWCCVASSKKQRKQTPPSLPSSDRHGLDWYGQTVSHNNKG
eukprot:369395-Amphidinium_carterae.2